MITLLNQRYFFRLLNELVADLLLKNPSSGVFDEFLKLLNPFTASVAVEWNSSAKARNGESIIRVNTLCI